MANIVIKKPVNTNLRQELDELNQSMSKYSCWQDYILEQLEKYRENKPF